MATALMITLMARSEASHSGRKDKKRCAGSSGSGDSAGFGRPLAHRGGGAERHGPADVARLNSSLQQFWDRRPKIPPQRLPFQDADRAEAQATFKASVPQAPSRHFRVCQGRQAAISLSFKWLNWLFIWGKQVGLDFALPGPSSRVK